MTEGAAPFNFRRQPLTTQVAENTGWVKKTRR
jgi:hypothetical protein